MELPMLDVAQILGGLSIVFLGLAGAAALKKFGGLQLQKVDGSACTSIGNASMALWFPMKALVSSTLSAVLAMWHAGGF
jgi:hypothetical protein